MKFITKGAVGALMLIGFAAPAMAQTASANATGSITIYQPLSLNSDVPLAFGRVVRPENGPGSVVVANDGTPTFNGVVGLSSTRSAAQFNLSGEGGSLVNVTVPASFNLVNQSVSSADLVVTTTNDLGGTSTTLSNGAGATGVKTFHVGGSIPIPSTTASGAYSGTLTVNAVYN